MAPLSREAAWLQEPVPASALFTEVQEGKFVILCTVAFLEYIVI
jgi:hypothetical protein